MEEGQTLRQLGPYSRIHWPNLYPGFASARLVDQKIVSPFPDASIQQAKKKACCQKPFGFPCAHVFAICNPAVCLQMVYTYTSCFSQKPHGFPCWACCFQLSKSLLASHVPSMVFLEPPMPYSSPSLSILNDCYIEENPYGLPCSQLHFQ